MIFYQSLQRISPDRYSNDTVCWKASRVHLSSQLRVNLSEQLFQSTPRLAEATIRCAQEATSDSGPPKAEIRAVVPDFKRPENSAVVLFEERFNAPLAIAAFPLSYSQCCNTRIKPPHRFKDGFTLQPVVWRIDAESRDSFQFALLIHYKQGKILKILA